MKRYRYTIRRNKNVVAAFLQSLRTAVFKFHGKVYSLGAWQWNPGTGELDFSLVERPRIETEVTDIDGTVLTFQIHPVTDFKYSIRHLRKVCL